MTGTGRSCATFCNFPAGLELRGSIIIVIGGQSAPDNPLEHVAKHAVSAKAAHGGSWRKSNGPDAPGRTPGGEQAAGEMHPHVFQQAPFAGELWVASDVIR
jgi:hypothetical protein